MAEISILPYETVQTRKSNSGNKQDKLVSGKNIKTINGETILGEGDLDTTPDALKSFITVAPLSDSRAIIDAFNKYSLNKKLGTLIPAFIKRESFDKDYTLATLVVEDYNEVSAGYRLTFTLLGTKTNANSSDMESIYSPDVFSGVRVLSYLYSESMGYIIPLGEGEIKDRRVDELIETSVTKNALIKELSDMSAQITNDVLSAVQEEGSDVFKAIYGTTTYEEVLEAYNEGKVVLCDYQNNTFHINRVTASSIYFISVNGSIVYRITLNSSNNWYQNTIQNEQSTNKVPSLSESSTDAQYPSAKAVYDFVQNSKDVFAVAYEGTTYDEIVAANNAGKVVICQYGNIIARLTEVYESVVYFMAGGNYVTRLACFKAGTWSRNFYNHAHELTTLDNGNVKVFIADKSAEVATPAYVSDAIASAITNVLNEEV